MNPIIYIFKKRSQQFFDKENNPERILILLNMFGFYYIPKLLSSVFEYSDGPASPYLLYIINNLILFTPLLSLFLPTFEAKKNILPSYLPMPKRSLFLLDCIASIGKRASLSIIAMTAGFFIYFHFADKWVYVSIGLTGIIALMMTDAITNVLSWQKAKWWAAIIIAAALNLLPKWTGADLSISLCLKLVSVFILGVTLWYSYSIHPASPKGSKTIIQRSHISAWSILLKEITRSGLAKTSITIIFALKIFVLFAMPYFGESYLAGSQLPVVSLLFYSPIFLFASIFNNSFGYFRNLFVNIWLYDNRTSQYIKFFASLLFPLLLADITISMLFLLWFKLLTWPNIIIYFSSALYLIIVAGITSCLLPKKIEQRSLSGIKKGSSSWSSMISMIPLLIVTGFHLRQICPTLVVCLGIAFVAIPVLIKKYGAGWQTRVIQAVK